MSAIVAPLRWVIALVTFVIIFTLTTSAYGSHGTRRATDVVADPTGVLYALTWDQGVPNGEVWRSLDGGGTWSPTGLAHPSFHGLAIAPTTPDPTLYVYSDCTGDSNCAGLRKSTDGGATWTTAGFPNARVFGVTIAPDMPTTLYAQVAHAGTVGWFKSTDAGMNWTDTNWPNWTVGIDRANRLYGLNGYDILVSLDGGMNWSVVLTLPQPPFTEDGRYDMGAIAPFVAVSGSTVYAVNSTYLVPYCDPQYIGYCEWYPEPATVSYSNDGGSTWNVGVLGYYHVWDLAVHGSTLYAATTKHPYVYCWCTDAGVITSPDGGAHWVDTSLNIGNRVLGVDSNAVYAVTSEGLFKRAHNGGNWTATALAPHPSVVTSLSLPPSVTGGSTSTGTVTLSASAPTGGVTVALSSSNTAAATVPSGVTVLAGSTTATFAVATNPVTASTAVTISASQSGVTKTATLTVNPQPAQFILSLSTVGSGTITASPAPVSGKYAAGTVVSLTATPAAGSQFGDWSGACSGTGACSVTMDAAKNVTATFAALPPPGDTTPPVRSNGLPSGTLAAGTTQTTLSLATNENATCRYAITVGVAYALMPYTFTTTGGTAHSLPVNGLKNGRSYSFYVRCRDAAANANTNDFSISFAVAQSGDTTPPTRSNGSPTSTLPAGTTQTVLSLATNENATCRYATTAGVAYAAMPYTFGTTGGTAHSTPVNGLTNGGSYSFYVRCRDAAANANTNDFSISFAIAQSGDTGDTTPPARSNGSPTGTLPAGTTQMTLSLATNENATCRYAITVGVAYAAMPYTFATTGGIAHSLPVNGLKNGRSYSFFVRCRDAAANANTNDFSISFAVAQ